MMDELPEVKPAVIESMKRMLFDQYTLRIWRGEDSIQSSYDFDELEENVREWVNYRNIGRGYTADMLAMFVLKQPRVNAVEVVDNRGDGIVLYREWP
jgi:hypothetical protein